jgi:hypothetical protein
MKDLQAFFSDENQLTRADLPQLIQVVLLNILSLLVRLYLDAKIAPSVTFN